MKIQILALLILATGTAMAKPSGGQEKRTPPTAADFIQKLDKDGDGLVSMEEFDGPDEHFTESDKNEDGYLSEDEVPSGPPPPGEGRK
jgi:hypothetical protein